LKKDTPIEVFKARSKVVSRIHLYTFKFQEFFLKFNDNSFRAVWSMVEQNKITTNKVGEKLLKNTLRYFGEMLTYRPDKAEFIKENLNKVFDILVLPNISIT